MRTDKIFISGEQLKPSQLQLVRKRWGLSGVEIVKGVDATLHEYGFVFIGGADPKDKGRYISWAKSLDSDLSFDVTLCLDEQNGSRFFSTALSVDSQRVRDVLISIKDWECSESAPQTSPVCLMHISLEWWVAYHERRESLLREKFFPTWQVTDNPSPEIAAWRGGFVHYGWPFLENLRTYEGIVSFLKGLGQYPKKSDGFSGAPGCASQEINTAILLDFLGCRDEAYEELIIEEARSKALLSKGEYYRIGYETSVCRISRLRNLFSGVNRVSKQGQTG